MDRCGLIEDLGHIHSPLRESKAETPGRNPTAGTESEAMQECYLLSFSWLAQPAFLCHSGPPAYEWHCPQ